MYGDDEARIINGLPASLSILDTIILQLSIAFCYGLANEIRHLPWIFPLIDTVLWLLLYFLYRFGALWQEEAALLVCGHGEPRCFSGAAPFRTRRGSVVDSFFALGGLFFFKYLNLMVCFGRGVPGGEVVASRSGCSRERLKSVG